MCSWARDYWLRARIPVKWSKLWGLLTSKNFNRERNSGRTCLSKVLRRVCATWADQRQLSIKTRSTGREGETSVSENNKSAFGAQGGFFFFFFSLSASLWMCVKSVLTVAADSQRLGTQKWLYRSLFTASFVSHNLNMTQHCIQTRDDNWWHLLVTGLCFTVALLLLSYNLDFAVSLSFLKYFYLGQIIATYGPHTNVIPLHREGLRSANKPKTRKHTLRELLQPVKF